MAVALSCTVPVTHHRISQRDLSLLPGTTGLKPERGKIRLAGGTVEPLEYWVTEHDYQIFDGDVERST